MTPASFAEALLVDLGIKKPSAGDVAFVEEWETAEGGNWVNTAKYNPLNTSQHEPGSRSYQPGAGVQSYTSWASGLAATVATLRDDTYSGIVKDLRRNQPDAAEVALAASPWDASHYANGFPTAAAAAAYVKTHGGVGGGGESTATRALHIIEGANPVSEVKELGGLLGSHNPVSSAASDAATDVVNAFGKVVGPVETKVKDLGIYAGFAGVGLVLIVGGLLSMTKGARQKVTDSIGSAAPAAGAGAGASSELPEAAAVLA
jgi:hypothetical protein